MKTMFKPVCVFVAVLSLTAGATAQAVTVVWNFSNGSTPAVDQPIAGVVVAAGTLYGTTAGLNSNAPSSGTVFKVNTNGTGFTNFYNFSGAGDESDGAFPWPGLILSSDILYGANPEGGPSGDGAVFGVNTNGNGFTNLYYFSALTYDFSTGADTNSDGANPLGELVLSGNALYGTAYNGGSSGNGTVFGVTTDHGIFSNFYNFTALTYDSSSKAYTNGDGASPWAGLALADGTLYGTAEEGGLSGSGTVFRVNTNGNCFTNLYSFGAVAYNSPTGTSTNSDGAFPVAGLVLADNTLYGTAEEGGPSGSGTIFRINTDGSCFTNLYYFTATSGLNQPHTNSDGANPYAGLTLAGGTLYGTTKQGGVSGNGTVFRINTNGSGFATLYNFTATSSLNPYTNRDGANPCAGLMLTDGVLYGTTENGGSYGVGTVFTLDLPALLNIALQGADVVLSWSNPAFSLQAAPTVAGIFTNVIGSASPYTNTVTSAAQFFRLQEN